MGEINVEPLPRRRSKHSYVSRLLLLSTLFLISNFNLQSTSVQAQEIFVAPNRELQTLDDDDDELDNENNQILEGAADFPMQNKPAGLGQGELNEVEAIKKKATTQSANVPKANVEEWVTSDLVERYNKGEIKVMLESIFPRGGPTYGTTRVTVRSQGLTQLVDAFPNPKCKFGLNTHIVDATYVKCSKKPKTFYEREGDDRDKNETCVQCDSSPPQEDPQITDLQVSLTGKFDDVYSSLPYRYYRPLKIEGIYPRYGPKDGDTVVQVWGQNFLDLGDDFRCNFGSSSTKAYYINDNYIWCRAAFSDVVDRPMPFSVSLNRQQNSLQNYDYWYYNRPLISKVIPDYGSMSGGTKLLVKGSGFLPFDWKLDINNQNDTFCNFGPLGKTPAFVISSTEAECVTPPNAQHLEYAPLNLTLNNQNYTQSDIRFIYYNPPKILDAEPLIGPVMGGTEVNLWGSQFEKRRNITCFFNEHQVQARYVSKEHLVCKSPEVQEPGEVKLIVKYQNDRFESDVLTYTYFANPVLNEDPLSPSCGPIEGFTQITVRGKNFVEFHFGQAKCIFNETIYMNATVLNSDTLVCDSPVLDTTNSEMWYKVAVTLDGTYVTNTTGIFKYYREPTMSSITPARGPLSGSTSSVIKGKGFNQTNFCAPTVRYGRTYQTPKDRKDTSFTAVSPTVHVPGDVVVSFSGNGQQFIDDKTLHFRDVENNFQYYEDFFVKSVVPTDISNAGNSPIILRGMQFDQFKYDNGTKKDVQLQCRFKEEATGAYIDEPRNMTRMTDSKLKCVAPKTNAIGSFRLEMSANGQDWQDIGHEIRYFNGPRVTGVNPTYGVTKNPKNLNLEIYGENFVCPNNDCSKIKARFTNALGDQIFMDAKMSEANSVIVPIPKYPAPETLDVDVSFNDQDFTNDGVKFGFLDPFILGIQPRLLSTEGTTKLNITGYGFVSMEETKQLVVMKNMDENLQCQGSICTKVYKVMNENSATIDTFKQEIVYKSNKNIEFDAFTVNMMNPDGDFTKNDINLWYYKDPNFESFSTQFAYANEEKPIMIKTDFYWADGNDFQTFRKYSNFTCKFTSENDASKTFTTYAIMETSPIGQYNKNLLPDQIRCRTPKWGSVDTAQLQISVNGQDYIGSKQISFVDKLEIYKISPLSGPIGGETNVKLYGSGFASSIPHEKPLFIKFGTIETQIVEKSEITDFTWSSDMYHSEFHTPASQLVDAEAYDYPLEEGQIIKMYIDAVTPDITRQYSYTSPDVKGLGGPVYIRIGESVPINITGHDKAQGSYGMSTTGEIDVVYSESSDLEFYFYRQPIVQKIEPTSGLTSGGTDLELTGTWFDQQPQYGVLPFCQIGNHTIRARYITSNRIICKTPASTDTAAPSPIAVSLNGVDFQDTGFTFSYYEKPVIVDLQPRSGSIEGGTEIWLKGLQFSNITHGMRTVKCRFRQIPNVLAGGNATFDEDNAPVKFIPAYYVDNETMKCASPSGWVGGDQVKVDLTFNGVDYTDASFVFSFYNIFGSFPKSGPSDAYDQFIQVKGQGFRSESSILCVLNQVEYAPLQVHAGVIKCPMVKDTWPIDQYTSVPFHILIDGSTHEFGNFHYYKRPTLEDVSPLIGPQEGRGAIYFIGRDFRDDFENSKLGCRVGNVLGYAQLIDSETIRCQVSKKIPLVDEGQSLSVSVALNSYSWIQSEFSFTPYGIIDFYPNSGPIGENTNILIVGKGFENEMKEFARCKFGTDDNYVIVEGQVLDNEHMICKSPSEEIVLPDEADEVISLPFSIAFQEDIYYPYTEGPQKYRLYKHPTIIDITPNEAKIGRLTEVYIIADDDDSFWQPIPTVGGLEDDNYGIKCKFGRFGSSAATYVNKTHILCLTPNIQDDPADISEESVQVTVAMNGVDFNDDYSEVSFNFIGTGGSISILVIIMGTLIFGLLIVSVLIFLGGLQEFIKQRSREEMPRNSYTQVNERGNLGPAMQSRASNRSRSNQGNFGRPRSRASDFAVPGNRSGGGSRANQYQNNDYGQNNGGNF